ncbi:DUF3572 family protein [Croceibacterium aestuarii]|uniref:DUF3572 family protein n=1 Tax=Croceibacterium aestuarii TaxID=3064139 RepID=UPI00272EB788|nr:DUF3572 family protein [Croceibacterium sp. D39]
MQEERRARRFLDLTGLTPEILRERIASREVQLSVLDFLCAHEPDLMAVAEAIDLPPAQVAAAREALAL